MQLPLAQLADIRTGLTLRGPDASRRTDKEGVQLLRISDLKESGAIVIDSPHLLDRKLGDDPRFKVSPNDLLVANRGIRMTAALVPKGLEAVASGQLFIVRPHASEIIPEYLQWFLNLDSTQDHLRANARGSYVKTLPISVVKELKIPLIPVEVQRTLCEFSALAQRESELLSSIAVLRRQSLQATFNTLIKKFTT